jgi:hypothetical protein
MDDQVLSHLTDAVDDTGKKIHDEFMGLYMLNEMSRKQVEFRNDADNAGLVYTKWLNTGICLLKANAHARNFKKLLEEKRAEFEKEIEGKKTGNMQHYYWDLSVEVEGLITQLKAALDSFAVLIGTTLRLPGIRGWSKAKPEGKTKTYSGQKIINVLSRNLPKQDLVKLQDLIDFINDNKEELSKIINVRDGFIHPYQLFSDFTTGFYYDKAKDEVIEPAVRYGDIALLQSKFVEMAFNYVYDTLVCSGVLLLNGIALGMKLGFNGGVYQWYMVNPPQMTKEPNSDNADTK